MDLYMKESYEDNHVHQGQMHNMMAHQDDIVNNNVDNADAETETEVTIDSPNDRPSRIIAIVQLVLSSVLLIAIIILSFILGIGEFMSAALNVPFTLLGILSVGLLILSSVLTLVSSRFEPMGMYRACATSWIVLLVGNLLLFTYTVAMAFGLAVEHPYQVWWESGEGYMELLTVAQMFGVVAATCVMQFLVTISGAIGFVQIYIARRRIAKQAAV